MEVLADRETFNVWWELSCSREAQEGREIRVFQAQTPRDLGEEIINTSTLGRIKEKGNQQVLQGHICSINLIKSSPCRVALTAWIPSSSCFAPHNAQRCLTRCILILITDTTAMQQHKEHVHNLLLQISPLVLRGNFPHMPPESN